MSERDVYEGRDSQVVGRELLEYRDNPPLHDMGAFDVHCYALGDIIEIVMRPNPEFTTGELLTRLAHLMGVDEA